MIVSFALSACKLKAWLYMGMDKFYDACVDSLKFKELNHCSRQFKPCKIKLVLPVLLNGECKNKMASLLFAT